MRLRCTEEALFRSRSGEEAYVMEGEFVSAKEHRDLNGRVFVRLDVSDRMEAIMPKRDMYEHFEIIEL